MSNTSTSPLLPPDSVAEVRAREHVIRYRRAGSGAPVLVLVHPDVRVSPGWSELLPALASRFRVLIPELDTAVAPSEWLTGFLEGLGASTVDVIADDPFWLPAVQLALADQDQVARLVVVVSESDDDVSLTSALAAGPRSAAIPLLLVARNVSTPQLVQRVTDFLGAASDRRPVEAG